MRRENADPSLRPTVRLPHGSSFVCASSAGNQHHERAAPTMAPRTTSS